MVLQGQMPGEKKLDDLFGGGTFWENVDWSRTRAYAMGLGQIYVNLQGREGKGIVPEREYDQLLDSLIIDLMSFLDPHHAGSRRGRRLQAQRDLQWPVLQRRGRSAGRASKAAIARRGRPRSAARRRNVIEPNMKKWSGDHGSSDYKDTAGILITNRKPTAGPTRIIDIAPTVLKFFGLAIPAEIDGRPLF